MKKTLLLIVLSLCAYINSYAQATSLTVENKVPSQLSTLISKEDQKTVENIRITGVLNYDDIKFIGTLMKNYSLHGIIDLEDAVVFSKSNVMNNLEECSWSGTAKHIKFPISLTKMSGCITGVTKVDTVTLGGPSMPSIDGSYLCRYADQIVKNLIIREGSTVIEDLAFGTNNLNPKSILSTVVLPSTIQEIDYNAFANCSKLKNINLPDNINTIRHGAFLNVPAFADTVIILPKNLQTYVVASFSYSTSGNYNECKPYHNQVVYIPESVTKIDGIYDLHASNGDRVIWHIDNINPPSAELSSITLSDQEIDYLNAITVYVPKSSVNTYKEHFHWKYTNVIAEPVNVELISLDRNSIKMIKGNTDYLQATITPSDADNPTIKWYSSDPSIVTVNQNGEIKALNTGEAFVYVMSNENNAIKDSCNIVVHQPVKSLNIDARLLTLKVEETYWFKVTFDPSDADNKKVLWSSTDEAIAKVDANGMVTAVNSGEAWIKAVSEDNPEACDSCKVTVSQSVTDIELDITECTLNKIGQTVQLIATVLPENASNKNVNWKSSNESVCIVSNGKVVAVGFGKAVVIATTEEGGYMAICTVTVEEETAALKGDVNLDGKVDISDVVAVINTMAGDTTFKATSDVNNDGKTDISDVVSVINIMAGSSE